LHSFDAATVLELAPRTRPSSDSQFETLLKVPLFEISLMPLSTMVRSNDTNLRFGGEKEMEEGANPLSFPAFLRLQSTPFPSCTSSWSTVSHVLSTPM
jgi:hypothetical protein